MSEISRILDWLDCLGVRYMLYTPEDSFPINVLIHQSHRWIFEDIQHYRQFETPQSLVRWAHSMGFQP